MDYCKNEDKLCVAGSCGIKYNAVLGVAFSAESTTEPVSAADALLWCRIDIAENTPLIEALISTARAQAEQYTNLSLINRTVNARLRNELGGIYIPYGPVVGELEGEKYGRYETKGDDLEIEYQAGFDVVPGEIKRAILMQVAYLYEHRGDETMPSELSPMSKHVLLPHRRV